MKFVYTIICLLFIIQVQATVRRVRAGITTPGNGSTWAAAYSNLQSAIDASAAGDEVWVAIPIGVAKYQPTSGVSFSLRAGVKIYGGFNGTEAALANRNFTTNVTTLQGNGNSVVKSENNSLINSTTQLDGFTITGGSNSFGGGIYCGSVSPSFSNLIIKNNYASIGGGGIYVYNGIPSFNNCVITNNNCSGTNATGGGMYNEDAYPTLTNCVIANNYATKDGGGLYSYISYEYTESRKPVITNCVFAYNEAGSGAGGGIFGQWTTFIITNCTFFGNVTYLAGCGGGLHNYSNRSDIPSNSIVRNCIFWLNSVSSNGTYADVVNNNVTATISYSLLLNAPAGNNNQTPVAPAPFVDGLNSIGNDGIWLTADDGLRLSPCNGRLAVDKGNNSYISLTTDILGNPRKVDNGLIADSGSGTAPIVDMGAYEEQTTATASQLAGTIGNAHLVPVPQETNSDSVSNTIAPASGLTVVRWESSTDGVNWATATPASTLNYYRFSKIGTDTLKNTTQFRRVASSAGFCNIAYNSNVIQIRVNSSNGVINGKVFSNNTTTGVKGVTIKIKRRGTATPSSPAGYTYTTLTGDDGTYSVNPIYYGDQSINTTKDSFWVIPVRTGHTFDRDSISKILSTSAPGISGVDFKDLTTYAVAGQTYQQLMYINPQTNLSETQTCPLDSVDIWKDGSHNTYSGFNGTAYGRYGVTISDPGNIKLYPKFNGHVFTPDTIRLNVNTDFSGQDFRDVTNHVISGSLTAGCGSTVVGTATLEFSSQTPDGITCFTRLVKTDSTLGGAFSVSLPARKYKVRIIRFKAKAGANVDSALLVYFINNLPADSLTRNITTHDTTLNLVYMRPPVISITGLNIVCNTPMPFALIPQAITDSFRVFITQGNPSYACPAVDTSKIVLQTNIQGDDGTDIAKVALADTGIKVKLTGGIPNITSDHLKDLFINFTDKYGRPATSFSRKVLVTGIKSDVGTFTTVSPQIPLLVLHDPPGDQSYSTWQSNHTVENALRFYSGTSRAVGGWLEAKIGTKFQAGIGVSTETNIWGSINASINTSSKSTTSGEAIISTTTSQSFSTANNPDVIGGQGDVYIGAALNLKYATATDIAYSNCNITSTRKLAVADSGFSTQYIYTENHIRNTIIPQLYMFISLTSSPTIVANYLNQIHVWQQVLDNNATNKSRAAFVENHSFNGAAGPYTNTTTTSASKSSTIEFNMDMDVTVAAALGLEVAGSGVSGGVSVAFKMETGNSTTNTVTDETTIAYTLDDDDADDFFSVNVKKDPVYNTPVFELAAGTASCPPEEGAQPRDDMYFTATNPVALNVPATAEANFRLKIVNTSQSHEPRRYQLSYDQGSNVDNETIKIAGSPYVAPVLLDEINYLDSSIKTVSITRAPSSSVYSYEGVRFRVSDICGGDVSKTVIVTAQYVAPCSSISLTQPENNWLITSASNNLLYIKAGGYTQANLTSVTLEYSQSNTSNWSQGPTLNPTQLADGFNWNVATLADGSYNIRLRLDCQQGTTYSQRASGIIDRKAPTLFGRPDPTDDNYVTGDVISFSYNEKIITPLDSVKVTMQRLGTNTLIPVTVSSYENKIIIVPASNIAAFTGDSIRVIVKDIADQYGNVKVTPDTVQFLIGNTTLATGNNALTLSIANPTVFKNSDSTINVRFKLPVNTANDMRVNYSVSGTARLGIDYNIVYAGSPQPLYTSFNGSQGTIAILRNTKETLLKIVPISNYQYDTIRTINVSLNEGGDYNLGTPASVSGKITNEDSVMVYKFIGDGNFNDRNNWDSLHMPFSTLIAGKKIIINPGGTGKCILNVPLSLRLNSTLIIMTGKEFIVPSILKLQR